ncbi:MAG: Ku protein, partial [Candidatus Binatia bacterium]
REAVERKVAGQETTASEPVAPRAQVIDLMEALKQSLARERTPAATKPAAVASGKQRATGGPSRSAGAKKKQ